MNKEPSKKILGYYMSTQKAKRISFSDVIDSLLEKNIETVKIDLKRPLIEQGTFDGFILKLNEDLIKAELLKVKENQECIRNLRCYIAEHPSIVLIDSPNSIEIVLNRIKTYNLINEVKFQDANVFVPPYIIWEDSLIINCDKIEELMKKARITFPVVCKPIVAQGIFAAHQMSLVFNNPGLKEVSYPCLIQSFVNHNGVIYKIFAIGEDYFIVRRPSIINLYPSEDAETIHFHSDEISKPSSTSFLISQDKKRAEDEQIQHQPCPAVMKRIIKTIHTNFRLGLLGIDVCLEEKTGKYAIVDINAFPGYEGVPNFPERLASYIRTQFDKNDEKIKDME